MRRVPFYPLLITALVSIGGYLGCDPHQVEQQVGQQLEQHLEQQLGPQLGPQVGQVIEQAAQNSGLLPSSRQGGLPVSTARGSAPIASQQVGMPARSANTLIIGSFNMQRLGPTKLADRAIMEYYADIIRRFDVIALQEITSNDQNTVATLLQYVNANGSRYSYTLSPQIGRTPRYLEQYAYVFDTARVVTRQDACFVMRDEEDLLHREPFVGRFATVANVRNPFSFALINIHTDPDEVATELNTLANVVLILSDFFMRPSGGDYPEDDVMLLGDLNADPSHFRNLGQLPNFIATIVGIPTNYTRTKTNDNILVNRVTTREFTGRSGALDLQTLYSISQADAKRISDHQPVWAEFYVQEAVGTDVAAQGNASFMR